MRIRILLSLAVVVALAGVLLSQTQAEQNRSAQGAQNAQGTQIDVNVVSVPLTVSVVDNKGKVITDLKKEDFKVYEDDKLQVVRSFTRDTDLPLSIALLMDSSGSVIDKLKFEKAAATDFFFNTIKRRKDRATVISFDSAVWALMKTADSFTDEPELLSNALKEIQSGGGTAVYDAVYKATDQMLSKEAAGRKKMIILISDGEDTASRWSLTEALDMAQRHDVTVYAISTNKTSDTRSRGKVEGDDIIQKLADETGGKAYFPLKLDDLASDFQKIGEELRSQYVLSYTPTNPELDGTYRKVRVEMVNGKYKSRVRAGYFASKR